MIVKKKRRVQIKIGEDLAGDIEAVSNELGSNPTMAINIFYKRIVANGALSFNASLGEEEGANLRLLKATEGTSVTESKDAEEIADWFNDPDED